MLAGNLGIVFIIFSYSYIYFCVTGQINYPFQVIVIHT